MNNVACCACLILVAGCSDPPANHQARHGPIAGVRSLDVYRDGDVLHLLTGESQSEKENATLRYQRSADGGITWSQPIRVDPELAPPHDLRRGKDAQIAASGNDLIAVWTTTGTGWGGSGPLATAVSWDGGLSWRGAPNPADDGATTGHDFVDVVRHDGRFEIVWLDERRGKQGLRHASSSDRGMTWSRNATLDKETCECCSNTLASGESRLFALYRDSKPRDMALIAFEDGETGNRRERVGDFDWYFNACPHTGGGLAIGADTLHAAVWTGKDGATGVSHLYSRDEGKSWSKPGRLGTADAKHPDIAVARDGKIAVAWDDSAQNERAIFAATSTDGGKSWTPASRVSAAGANASHPRVVAGKGGIKIFWTEAGAHGAHVLMQGDL